MNRYAAIALSGAAAAGLAVVLAFQLAREDEVSAPAGPDAVTVAPAPEVAEAPVFDVVRVSPNGDTVVAGRARPKAELVIVRVGEGKEARELGRAVADMRGEWVFVPDLPLAPGPLRLVAEIHRADGSVVRSRPSADLEVPGRDENQEVSAPAR